MLMIFWLPILLRESASFRVIGAGSNIVFVFQFHCYGPFTAVSSLFIVLPRRPLLSKFGRVHDGNCTSLYSQRQQRAIRSIRSSLTYNRASRTKYMYIICPTNR
jgi:hypothetical protein